MGDATVTITLRTTYTDEGATAEDNSDGDLSSSITVSNPVDEKGISPKTWDKKKEVVNI